MEPGPKRLHFDPHEMVIYLKPLVGDERFVFDFHQLLDKSPDAAAESIKRMDFISVARLDRNSARVRQFMAGYKQLKGGLWEIMAKNLVEKLIGLSSEEDILTKVLFMRDKHIHSRPALFLWRRLYFAVSAAINAMQTGTVLIIGDKHGNPPRKYPYVTCTVTTDNLRMSINSVIRTRPAGEQLLRNLMAMLFRSIGHVKNITKVDIDITKPEWTIQLKPGDQIGPVLACALFYYQILVIFSSTMLVVSTPTGTVLLRNQCTTCGAEATGACERCKETTYCSKECQKNDWEKHKKKCR